MALKWILQVKRGEAAAAEDSLALTATDPDTGQQIAVIPACRSVKEFAEALGQLKEQLDGLAQQARQEWSALEGAGQGAKTSPSETWQKMEQLASEEAMFQYFNDLPEPERQRIAEYVFSHVNMFKGRGPVFSEHYNASAHVLE